MREKDGQLKKHEKRQKHKSTKLKEREAVVVRREQEL